MGIQTCEKLEASVPQSAPMPLQLVAILPRSSPSSVLVVARVGSLALPKIREKFYLNLRRIKIFIALSKAGRSRPEGPRKRSISFFFVTFRGSPIGGLVLVFRWPGDRLGHSSCRTFAWYPMVDERDFWRFQAACGVLCGVWFGCNRCCFETKIV